MASRPRKTTRLTVSIEEQDHDALAKLADASDVSLSWLIRQAIRQFIKRSHSVDKKGEDTLHARASNKD